MKIPIQVRVISQTKKNVKMSHFQVQGGVQSGSNGSTFLFGMFGKQKDKGSKVPKSQTQQLII